MTYEQPLSAATNATIRIKLFKNVKNVPHLRKQIISGALKCCIIKPNLIVDPFQIVVAANKALTANKMTTRTMFAEILFNLSISKNITQSLQKFGIDDNEKDIIVVVIDKGDFSDKVHEVYEQIKGEEVDILCLKDLTDLKEVKKAYKLSDTEYEKLSILDSVVSRIATKDCI
ncbi:hypothetical protein ILUMI_27087 [Ignelater luminosus]|uniref:Uncharacterized protein n=1 Tax=Ignelater luminosus TaxID=2038154 RepID=A0A8K0C6V1_IGNLU|nr:hypothetical protein ILUMI_27087 [Ignelater luminosus]